MSRVARAAEITLAATCIDFSDDPTPHKLAISAVFNDADKLVPDRSLKPGVSACDLEIRVADSRQQHTHQRLVRTIRSFDIFDFETFVMDAKRKHVCFFVA